MLLAAGRPCWYVSQPFLVPNTQYTDVVQSLAYYYIRTLIYRPAIGSRLGHKAAPARLSVSESAKHMIQIAQLLEERSMSFSFCLNKADLLLICGMTLLYQGIDLKQDSKMLKDNERLVNSVIKIVERMKAPSTYEFKRVASVLVTLDEPIISLPTPPRQSPDTSMAAPPPQQRTSPAPRPKKKSSHGHQSQQYPLGRHPGASMSETDLLSQQEKLRRMTMPNLTPVAGPGRPDGHRSSSRTSFDSVRPNPGSIMQLRDQRLSTSQAAMIARVSGQKTNLDFLSLGNPSNQPGSSSPAQNHRHVPTTGPPTQQQYAPIQVPPKAAAGGVSSSEWEALLGQIDGGQVNLYDAIYGGPQVSLETPVNSAVEGSWSPDSLDLSTFHLGDFGATQGGSLSEESLSSVSGGDDLSSLDFRDFHGNHGAMMPGAGDEGFMMEGMPVGGNFGL